MMKKPAIPKPTAAYMAAKRAECKKASPCDECLDDKAKAKEAMREQAPFWMSQATLVYNVPNSGINQDDPSINKLVPKKGYEYNGVSFDDSPVKYVNTMNGGGQVFGSEGKYLAMGSFFNNSKNDPPKNELDVSKHHQVVGRYFLVEVEKDYSIPNPNSCIDKDGTLFAPAGSFILAFSGTEPYGLYDLGLINQDFDWQPGTLPSLPEYEGYQKMIEASAEPTTAVATLSHTARTERKPSVYDVRRSPRDDVQQSHDGREGGARMIRQQPLLSAPPSLR